MKKRLLTLGLSLAAAAALSPGPAQNASAARPSGAAQAKYEPVADFDPRRDAAADIERAVAEAKRTKRHVLLDVGGKWCVWCRIMDDYFEKQAEVRRLREENYVTVKVNFSPENENREVLSKYPPIPAFPHLFVLDAEGRLLHSQPTAELEKGKSYDRQKMVAFLKKWAPAR